MCALHVGQLKPLTEADSSPSVLARLRTEIGKLEALIEQYEQYGMDTGHLEDSLTLIETTYIHISRGKPLSPG